ncbi:DUF6517 family protein [Halalkalirubrum salinum]|uniref:DUF6517 family protein n=1 Tax=Halalkalirubrum salinum TaxID=2563889 RepID=UPI0010FB58AD|nr:DUF6517 family protein [Halalkalirubrum salinum]
MDRTPIAQDANKSAKTRSKADAQSIQLNRSRRRLLATAGAIGAASLSGCVVTDFVTGEQVEFNAAQARANEDALSATGYSEYRLRDPEVTRTLEAAGQSRDVVVTNQVAEYDRAIEVLGVRLQGATFTVFSTPQVELFGQTFNPVGEMSTDELILEAQARYESIDSVDRDSERTETVLGSDVTVVRYRAEASPANADLTIDITLHVTEPIEAGEDFVICLAAHPRVIDETDSVNRLLAGVEHDA